MKPPVSAFPDPTGPLDATNRDYTDTALAGLNASRGDYLHGFLTTNSGTSLAAEDRVEFETEQNSRGDLTLDTVTNVGRFIGLKAGRTYVLQSQLWVDDSSNDRIEWQWHDVTAASRIGTAGLAMPSTSANVYTEASVAYAIITPTVDTDVEVRINFVANATAFIRGSTVGLSNASIVEIGANTISASGDYIGASLSSPISAVIVPNDPVVFDQVDYQRGLLSLDDVAGKVDGLKAGRTYELMATLSGDTDAGQLWYGWYDSNTDATLGTAGVSLSVDSAVSASPNPVARAIYTPSVDTSVEVRVVFASPTSIDISQFSVIQVKELGARAVEHGNRFGPGHLDGLAMVYNTVSTVDIAVGTARDSTDVIDITVESLLTANIAVSGAANGLDTGAEAADTWYALYVIDGPSVSPASLLSTSFTSPTLPANYTVFRRVGAMLNNGTSNFVQGWQSGNGRDREWLYEYYADQTVLNGGQSTVQTAVDCSAFMPPTSQKGELSMQFIANAAGDDYRFYDTRTSAGRGLMGFHNYAAAGDDSHWPQKFWVDGSQTFEYALSNALAIIYLYVLSYVDEL